MANTDYERRTAQDYTDQHGDLATRHDSNSWGMMVGIAAVVGIVAMLFIGFGSSGPDTQTQQPTAVERTAPTPTAPTTQPAPAPPATTPN
jgi:hypothetical protein